MRKILFILSVMCLLPITVLAYGHHQSTHDSGNTSSHKSHAHGSNSGNSHSGGGNGGNTPVPPSPAPVIPLPVTPAVSGEVRLTAYTTGYGFPDNTPPSATISNPVLHSIAGGSGTFSDPITVAVGHSISGNTDTLDYPSGTKFYIPNLRRYFIVEDTCGDGNSPQNGPCHTGYQGHIWLDLWVGGSIAQSSATLACEDTITDVHLVIENPASNYVVVPAPVFFGSCTQQFGDTIVTI